MTDLEPNNIFSMDYVANTGYCKIDQTKVCIAYKLLHGYKVPIETRILWIKLFSLFFILLSKSRLLK